MRRHSILLLVAAVVTGLLTTVLGASAAGASVAATPGAGAGQATPAGDGHGRGGYIPRLTVLTYNIHHGVGADAKLDLERIAQVIEAAHPDVVQLSEVDVHWGTRSDNVDQVAWLSQRLGLHAVFGKNLDLDPLESGQPRRQFGTAILSRYPIASWKNTLLPLKEGGEQRGLLQAQVRTPWGLVRVLGTHLQQTSTQERLDQVAAIKQLTSGCRQPSVLMGDLNAYPDSPEMASLLEKFSDTWAKVGKGDGFTFDSDNPKGRIDYVLTQNLVLPLTSRVIATQASDHMPVRTQLVFAPWPFRGC